jgi:hypothetical protein
MSSPTRCGIAEPSLAGQGSNQTPISRYRAFTHWYTA